MKVLVTGATGFIGSHLIEKLYKEGHEIKILARDPSKINFFKKKKIEVVKGDMGDKNSLKGILGGAEAVIHAAACTGGGWNEHYNTTVLGTQYLLEEAAKSQIKKFIHISSIVVYDINSLKKGTVITEKFSLEKYPSKVGPYAQAKIMSENLVREYESKLNCPTVIIRPGLVYGPRGLHPFFAHVGAILFDKFLLRIGSGKDTLPLVYVGNVVEGITRSLKDDRANHQTFNIVDQVKITKDEYIDLFVKSFRMRPIVIPFPYWVLMSLISSLEILGKIPIFKMFSGVSRYSIAAKFKPMVFDGNKIRRMLEWIPKYDVDKWMDENFDYFKKKYIF